MQGAKNHNPIPLFPIPLLPYFPTSLLPYFPTSLLPYFPTPLFPAPHRYTHCSGTRTETSSPAVIVPGFSTQATSPRRRFATLGNSSDAAS
jgi:hypothetical protein